MFTRLKFAEFNLVIATIKERPELRNRYQTLSSMHVVCRLSCAIKPWVKSSRLKSCLNPFYGVLEKTEAGGKI